MCAIVQYNMFRLLLYLKQFSLNYCSFFSPFWTQRVVPSPIAYLKRPRGTKSYHERSTRLEVSDIDSVLKPTLFVFRTLSFFNSFSEGKNYLIKNIHKRGNFVVFCWYLLSIPALFSKLAWLIFYHTIGRIIVIKEIHIMQYEVWVICNVCVAKLMS